jgi:hypothetical protein
MSARDEGTSGGSASDRRKEGVPERQRTQRQRADPRTGAPHAGTASDEGAPATERSVLPTSHVPQRTNTAGGRHERPARPGASVPDTSRTHTGSESEAKGERRRQPERSLEIHLSVRIARRGRTKSDLPKCVRDDGVQVHTDPRHGYRRDAAATAGAAVPVGRKCCHLGEVVHRCLSGRGCHAPQGLRGGRVRGWDVTANVTYAFEMMTIRPAITVPTDAVLLHFEIAEPGGLALSVLKANLDDLGELVAMAHVIVSHGERWPGSREAAEDLRVLRAVYGSPFIVDSEVIEAGKGIFVGLLAVGGLLGVYTKLFKTVYESRLASAQAQKALAEAANIRGIERREQIRFDRREAHSILIHASAEMEPETGWAVRRAVQEADPAMPDARKHALRVNHFLRSLWRLAQKETVVLEAENLGRNRR